MDQIELLQSIDRRLAALMMIAGAQLRASEEGVESESEGLDVVLSDLGFSQAEIGRVLGVSQASGSRSIARSRGGNGR